MTGKFGPETDEQALDLRSDILKEEEWENRMEKRALFYRRLREFFSLVRRQLKELYDIWFSRLESFYQHSPVCGSLSLNPVISAHIHHSLQ